MSQGWLRALVAFQLTALAVVGVVTAFSFSHFTLDERAHFSYVESIAQRQEIPEVGRDLISLPIEAVYEGVYPAPARVSPERQGLGGQSYEGFQPPLYYVVAAPVFKLAGADYIHKLRVLRLVGVVLMFVTAALLWLLARRMSRADEDPLPAFALGLTVLLWPGVVVRSVTVSNAALELVIGAALALVAWTAWERRSARWLVLLALVLGAGLLTRLSLVAFAPSVAVVGVPGPAGDADRQGPGGRRRRRPGRHPGRHAGAVADLQLPPLRRVSGEQAVRRLQEPILNPDGHQYGLGDVDDGVGVLTRAVVSRGVVERVPVDPVAVGRLICWRRRFWWCCAFGLSAGSTAGARPGWR